MYADGKISNFMQISAVKRYELTEGEARGLRVVEADNGKIRVLLNESKALDVMQLFYRGENVSFLSKNAFTLRSVPFRRRFEGGMLYTCGLDALGDIAGHEMHGSLHNTPAHLLAAYCGEDGILIEAEMRDSALFGKNLRLNRKIRMALGGNGLTVEDELINDGDTDENYCLLYHVNLGYPFLDEGARLQWDAAKITPRNQIAAQKCTECTRITAPEANAEENCYYVRLNRPCVSVSDGMRGRKFTLGYSGDTLPCFIEWKSMRCGDYALGLEPSTSLLDERFAYSRIGRGERIKFRLEMTVEEISGEKI